MAEPAADTLSEKESTSEHTRRGSLSDIQLPEEPPTTVPATLLAEVTEPDQSTAKRIYPSDASPTRDEAGSDSVRNGVCAPVTICAVSPTPTAIAEAENNTAEDIGPVNTSRGREGTWSGDARREFLLLRMWRELQPTTLQDLLPTTYQDLGIPYHQPTLSNQQTLLRSPRRPCPPHNLKKAVLSITLPRFPDSVSPMNSVHFDRLFPFEGAHRLHPRLHPRILLHRFRAFTHRPNTHDRSSPLTPTPTSLPTPLFPAPSPRFSLLHSTTRTSPQVPSLRPSTTPPLPISPLSFDDPPLPPPPRHPQTPPPAPTIHAHPAASTLPGPPSSKVISTRCHIH